MAGSTQGLRPDCGVMQEHRGWLGVGVLNCNGGFRLGVR